MTSTTPGSTNEVRELPDGPADDAGLTPRQRKVLEVIKDGDKVVTAGQNKIDQGSKVVIDNSIALKLQDTSTIQ